MANATGGRLVGLGLLLGTGCGGIDTKVDGDRLAPAVGFDAPANGTEVFEGTEVTFIAQVIDDGTSHADLEVVWYQDGATKCEDAVVEEDNRTSCTLTVSADTTVKLVATDPVRNSGEASTTAHALANQPPTVAFTEPIEGPEYYAENPLDLALVLSDDFDAPADLALSWNSDIDGVLSPSGGPATTDGTWSGSVSLGAGVHTLTVQATDSLGASASDSTVVEVFGANTVPECGLDVVSTNVVLGDIVEVLLTAGDEETQESNLQASLTSNIDGLLLPDIAIPASGEKTEYLTGLSGGTHTLEFRVIDGYGDDVTCSATVEVCDDRFYRDTDGDEFGDPDDSQLACEEPSGFVADDTDCDDDDAFTHPGAAEYEDATACMTDRDEDGYGATVVVAGAAAGTDCDDGESTTHPGAGEVCDEVDNDCDGTVDDGVQTTFYDDDDGDGYGDATSATLACSAPTGTVTDSTDCDDSATAVNPAASEVCDTIDNDCDGDIDDDDSSVDAATFSEFYADTDGDGYGDAGTTTNACAAPSGFDSDDSDCDDTNASVSPAATEVCDTIDNDCDGDIDDDDSSVDSTTFSEFYADTDGDGYGDAGSTTDACDLPTGFVEDDSDCDDDDDSVNPAATEVCDGSDTDEDCDGLADDDDSSVSTTTQTTWYADYDGDGYGDSDTTTEACDQPTGYLLDTSDCDDTDSAVNPAATEVCDAVDNDCNGDIDDDDGSVDTSTTGTDFYQDADGDGYGDAAASVTTCAQPTGFVSSDSDCDDGDSAVNPGAIEVCDVDDTDEDCDGLSDDDDSSVTGTFTDFYADTDGDGHGDSTVSTTTCDAPSGYVAGEEDCDDSDAAVNPDAYEVCGDGIDNDCNGDTDLGLCGALASATDADLEMLGENATDRGGIDVAIIPDVNGDGLDDILVGADQYDEHYTDDGRAYLILGGTSGSMSLGDADAIFKASSKGSHGYQGLGSALAGGDIDNDGYGDIVLGAYGADPRNHTGQYPGGVYVLRGPVTGEISLTSGADIALHGEGSTSASYAGKAVSVAGDVNGDTHVDILIGSYGAGSGSTGGGAAYLLLGPATTIGATADLSAADAKVEGTGSGDTFGYTVGAAGDLDGDGLADMLFGAYLNDDGGTNAGSVYITYGDTSITTSFSAWDQQLTGASASDQLGVSGLNYAGVGDLNGDGYADLVVPNQYDDTSFTDGGALHILYGPVSACGDTTATACASARITGTSTSAFLGRMIAALGDQDGDGLDDFAAGEHVNSKVYVVHGAGSLAGTSSITSVADATISGTLASDRLGHGLSGNCDVNGDGVQDLLTGAHSHTPGGAGAAHLYFGGVW